MKIYLLLSVQFRSLIIKILFPDHGCDDNGSRKKRRSGNIPKYLVVSSAGIFITCWSRDMKREFYALRAPKIEFIVQRLRFRRSPHYIRDLKQTTTATAQKKRFNEQNNSCARAL